MRKYSASSPQSNLSFGLQRREIPPRLLRFFRPRYALKPTDDFLVPSRMAIALQADSWWLRSDIIWSKPNAMPESIKSRPTRSYEHLLLLAKNQRYYYDCDAIREPHASSTYKRISQETFDLQTGGPKDYARGTNANRSARKSLENLRDRLRAKTVDDPHLGGRRQSPEPGEEGAFHPLGRNKRDVWSIPTQPFPGSHFGVAPEALVQPCILAGTSEKGYCGYCGSPWKRLTKRDPIPTEAYLPRPKMQPGNDSKTSALKIPGARRHMIPPLEEAGWEPSCKCHLASSPSEPLSGVVLDMFAGAGTSGVVALRHGRRFIGIDLNPDYVKMSIKRIEADAPLFNA